MNKAFVIINLTSGLGGATRRYISLFNYIQAKRDDYFLIINKKLYRYFVDNRFLKESKYILLVDLHEKDITIDRPIALKKRETRKKRRGLLRSLGRVKSFARLGITWLRFAAQFFKYYRQYRFGLVYTIFTGGAWSWPLRKILKFKSIHSYNDISLYSLSRSLMDFFDSEYWVLRRCDMIDFLSPEIKRRIEERFGILEAARVTISPNSFVDYKNFFAEYPKEKHAVFVGRMSPEKNPILFLESIAIFNNSYQSAGEVKFFMLGAGALDEEIKTYITQRNLTNVIFVGAEPDPWKYLRKSRVFVSLQRNNNYPSQALLEAMACENAIIATDVGETRLLVSREEGILVHPAAEEIAQAFLRLFTDPAACERLGRNARRKAIENHNIEKFAEYIFKITNG